MTINELQRAEGGHLIDPFGRHVSYLRVSVTDRCDFRCVYCMSEHMTFLPKRDLLTLEELDRLCSAFVERGVRKLRITGGEPLVRKNILWLFEALSRHLCTGALDELTLTTNGSQLPKYAQALADCGVRRVNISLDTLDPETFRRITRWGDFANVMQGIDQLKQGHILREIFLRFLGGQGFRRPGEDVPPPPRLVFQFSRRLLELLILQETTDQFFARIRSILVVKRALFDRQQHAGLDLQQGRGHDEKFTCHGQIQRSHGFQIVEILLSDQGDRYIVDVDLVLPDEMQQKIERTLKLLKSDLIGKFDLLHSILGFMVDRSRTRWAVVFL